MRAGTPTCGAWGVSGDDLHVLASLGWSFLVLLNLQVTTHTITMVTGGGRRAAGRAARAFPSLATRGQPSPVDSANATQLCAPAPKAPWPSLQNRMQNAGARTHRTESASRTEEPSAARHNREGLWPPPASAVGIPKLRARSPSTSGSQAMSPFGETSLGSALCTPHPQVKKGHDPN